jgi:hypothetical protein
VAGEVGRPCSPWEVQPAILTARKKAKGLPKGLHYRGLRHCFASLLISSGLDVKVVQTRRRHASAMTTLNINTYGHLWLDSPRTSSPPSGYKTSDPSEDVQFRTPDSSSRGLHPWVMRVSRLRPP